MRRGLADSTAAALQLVSDGLVLVSGAVADKATRLVAPGDPIVLASPPGRFVGRGGEKLEHALDAFDLNVAGIRAIDVGASTGGFTDCLLQRGAAAVTALDVGHGQLDQSLRNDARVTVLERVHVNDADPRDLGAPFALVVADVSFISLTSVAEALVRRLAAPGAPLVVLVKPQFEVSKAVASRGKGVVTDPVERQAALDRVIAAFVGLGAAMMGVVESPITGAAGNVEFLAYFRREAAS